MQAHFPCGEFLRVLGNNDRNRNHEPIIERARGVNRSHKPLAAGQTTCEIRRKAGLMVPTAAHALYMRLVRVVDSMASRFSYTLDSSLDSVNKVEEAAEQLAQKSGLDEDQTFQLTMAVREAAVNAVLHGNAYDPEKKITASFENTGSSLIIRISDQGNGLDPATLPDPLAPENLLSGSGRGIFLIRSFMDEVHFKLLHPGTELTLIKHLDSTQKSA